MKKIFTLLFAVMATVSAMAGVSFKVTNPMTVTDNTQTEVVVLEQTVELFQNEDETWSLKFYDFQSCNYDLGDITFDGIAVAGPVYYVYYLQCNEATGVVTNKTSQFYGKTLVLQMTGQLSEKGYGSQSLTFEIFCEEDEDCYFQGSFSPDEGTVDGIVVPAYYNATSKSGSSLTGEGNLGVINEEDGSVTFSMDGLKNVNSGEEYSTISLPGLEMGMGEEDGVYTLKAENATAVDENDSPITVKSLELTLVSNAGPDVQTADDDMGVGGDDDMGYGGDDDMGVGGDEMSEWSVSGTLVIVDPATSEEFTYEISTDESITNSISSVKSGANGAAEYFSLNGSKLNGAMKGINIVRKDGKTVKFVVK